MPQSQRYIGRASMSRSSSRMPIVESKTGLSDVDTYSEEVMLDTIKCKALGNGTEFGTQVDARDHTSGRSRTSEGSQHGGNWPL